jgi:hypothetical protein
MIRYRHLICFVAVVIFGCRTGRNVEYPGVIVSAEWFENQLGDPSLIVS